ncbi:MAG: ABC transporter substrate-binding protein [Roseivirga sp.]
MRNSNNLVWLAVLVLGVWFLLRQRSVQRSVAGEKVLEIVLTARVKGMDPAHTIDIASAAEVAKVYEGLLAYHYLKRPYELIPNLAAALPTVSEDGLTYTFKIKEGVKFHDDPCFPEGQGRELIAEDFVYSIKRIADPKVQSTGFYLIDGRIKGLNAWRKKYIDTPVDYTEAVEGLKALDRYTLQLTLEKPFPQFPYVLTRHFCYAVPQEAVQYYGQEFLNHPVGTGPFVLKTFSPQASELVYHKNPQFREKLFPSEASKAFQHLLTDAGKPLPLVDKIVARVITEEQPRWLKFQKGQLDYLTMAKDDFKATITPDKKLTLAMRQKEIRLLHETTLSVYYIAFNHENPLFKNNLKLRQAMSLAYDRKTLSKLFYDMSLVAQSIIPPGLAGYRSDYVNPYNDYDLERAQQLLAEAGYPGGKGLPVLPLDMASSTTHRQIGEHFARCMEQIGIRIQVVTNPWPELLKKVDQKSTTLHAMGWFPAYPNAEEMLQKLYGPNKAMASNDSNYDYPEYDKLYERASVMPDSPERTRLYEQMNKIAAEQVPLLYMVHKAKHVLCHSWLQNFFLSDFDYHGQEQYLNIDLEKKQAMKAKL